MQAREYDFPVDFVGRNLSFMVREGVLSPSLLSKYWRIREKAGYCRLSYQESGFIRDLESLAIRWKD